MRVRLRHQRAIILSIQEVKTKAIVCYAFCIGLSLLSSKLCADTISEADLSGVWLDAWLVAVDEIEPNNLIKVRNCLEFGPDRSTRLTRWFESGNIKVFHSPPGSARLDDDLLIVSYPFDQGKLKLVLSGWNIGRSKMIFGQMFLYDDDGLYNGIGVAFSPESIIHKRGEIDGNVFQKGGCTVPEELESQSQ